MGSSHSVSSAVYIIILSGALQSNVCGIRSSIHEHVVWIGCRDGECKIVGWDNFFLSINLRFGILRVPLLPVRINDFTLGEDSVWKSVD